MTVFRHQAGEFDALFNCGDDRLFAEDFQTGFQANANMIEMHVIGRADHQEIELLVGDQVLRGRIGSTCRDAFFQKAGQTGGIRIDVTGDLEAFVHSLEDITQIAKTESEPDNANFHSSGIPRLLS
jgi:hypothetical protein